MVWRPRVFSLKSLEVLAAAAHWALRLMRKSLLSWWLGLTTDSDVQEGIKNQDGSCCNKDATRSKGHRYQDCCGEKKKLSLKGTEKKFLSSSSSSCCQAWQCWQLFRAQKHPSLLKMKHMHVSLSPCFIPCS